MSRSYRKSPFWRMWRTEDKVRDNRRFRRINKSKLKYEGEDFFPKLRKETASSYHWYRKHYWKPCLNPTWKQLRWEKATWDFYEEDLYAYLKRARRLRKENLKKLNKWEEKVEDYKKYMRRK